MNAVEYPVNVVLHGAFVPSFSFLVFLVLFAKVMAIKHDIFVESGSFLTI